MFVGSDLVDLIPILQRRARRLLRCPVAAEDLVQEVLLRLVQKLKAGHEIDNLAAYAMRALHNQARMGWRGAAAFEPLQEGDASCAPVAMLRLECGDVLRAIAQLPPEQAALMRMICEGETSPAVMARRARVPVGTVMSRLARARARLRVALDVPPNRR